MHYLLTWKVDKKFFFLTKTKATFWQLASQKKIQKSQIQKASYGHGQITLEESKTQHPLISFITVIAHESCYFLFIAHFDSFFFLLLRLVNLFRTKEFSVFWGTLTLLSDSLYTQQCYRAYTRKTKPINTAYKESKSNSDGLVLNYSFVSSSYDHIRKSSLCSFSN